MSAFIDLSGQRFNYLTVIERVPSKNKGAVWLCRCDCGAELILPVRRFKRKTKPQKSCMNCFNKRRLIHGMTNTKEFFAWRGILSRCNDNGSKSYKDYGGRGIKCCEGWQNEFKCFYEDMGNAPSKKHSIGRIDNDGHYSCGKCNECNRNGWVSNCEWQLPKPQGRNKRNTWYVTFNGETKSVMDWCEERDMNYYLVTPRLRRGMSVEQAFTIPSGGLHPKFNVNGKMVGQKELAKKLRCTPGAIRNRIQLGWSYEQIINTPVKKYKKRCSK